MPLRPVVSSFYATTEVVPCKSAFTLRKICIINETLHFINTLAHGLINYGVTLKLSPRTMATEKYTDVFHHGGTLMVSGKQNTVTASFGASHQVLIVHFFAFFLR